MWSNLSLKTIISSLVLDDWTHYLVNRAIFFPDRLREMNFSRIFAVPVVYTFSRSVPLITNTAHLEVHIKLLPCIDVLSELSEYFLT